MRTAGIIAAPAVIRLSPVRHVLCVLFGAHLRHRGTGTLERCGDRLHFLNDVGGLSH